MKLPPEPEICIIGAGFAGLCAGVKLKEADYTKFTIFESNAEVGGTWLVNRYPGCACDVPSHLYSFSFAPKPDWTKHYSSQPEILEYLKDVTRQYDLYPHIRFQTRVESLRWNAPALKWIAVIHNSLTNEKETLTYDFVISGVGMLRIPNYPEEFCNFTGELIHSAVWNPNVDLTGKRVGVVGTGASAIQIVPSIVDKVEKLTVFQRRAPYLIPKIQFEYPEVCKWALTKVPGLRWATRATIFWLQELLYMGFQHNTIGAKMVEKISTVQRRSQISQEMLRKKMTPNYEFGCKRILPTNDYYPAIQKPNVEVVNSKIVQVRDRTILTDDGASINLDVLILATGYKAHDYFAPMTIIGKDSEDILHTWKSEGPKTYLGRTVCSSLPNYFSLLGPNTGLGHSSVIFVIECQVEWMIRLLQEMQKQDASYFYVKESAEDDFMHFYEDGHSKTVWGNANCGSWYANSKGKITTLWPHNLVSFWRLLNSLNTEVFDFK